MPADVADHLNESKYSNSMGVPFDKINRGELIFPVELVKDEQLDLRGKCEVRFDFIKKDGSIGREDGIILCRDVPAVAPDQGVPYDVYDLHNKTCFSLSSYATFKG